MLTQTGGKSAFVVDYFKWRNIPEVLKPKALIMNRRIAHFSVIIISSSQVREVTDNSMLSDNVAE